MIAGYERRSAVASTVVAGPPFHRTQPSANDVGEGQLLTECPRQDLNLRPTA